MTPVVPKRGGGDDRRQDGVTGTPLEYRVLGPIVNLVSGSSAKNHGAITGERCVPVRHVRVIEYGVSKVVVYVYQRADEVDHAGCGSAVIAESESAVEGEASCINLERTGHVHVSVDDVFDAAAVHIQDCAVVRV